MKKNKFNPGKRITIFFVFFAFLFFSLGLYYNIILIHFLILWGAGKPYKCSAMLPQGFFFPFAGVQAGIIQRFTSKASNIADE